MRQNAQLDLRIVGGEQRVAGAGDERGANLAAEFRAHGNILQVRVRGTEAARRRAGLAEAGVQAAGFGVNQFRQRVHVGGFELADFAVFEDFARQFVRERQFFEHVRGGRARFRRGAFRRASRPILSNRISASCCGELMLNSEPASSQMVFSSARISRSIVLDMAASAFAVDAHAVALHRGEHGRERQVDRFVEFREALRFDFLAQQRREALQMIGVFAGRAGERDVFLAQHHVGQSCASRWWDAADRNTASSRGGFRPPGPASNSTSFGSCTIFGRAGSRRNSPSAASISPFSSSHAVRETPACGEISIAAIARAEAFGLRVRPSASVSHTATSASRGIALRYFLSAAGDSSAAESLAAARGRGRAREDRAAAK